MSTPMLHALLMWALGAAFALALVLVLTWYDGDHAHHDYHDHATIAGREVPALTCQEDELIGWIGVDTLGCINYEEVTE